MTNFEALYTQYFRGVYRFVLSLCANADLAEEITQETFFKAMSNLKDFRGQSELQTWLCRIAKNQYIDHCRKQKNILGMKPELVSPSAMQDDPENAVCRNESLAHIHRYLHQMSEPYREVFMLRVFAELSHAQIASLFSKSEAWARTTFYRAKVQLQERMREKE